MKLDATKFATKLGAPRCALESELKEAKTFVDKLPDYVYATATSKLQEVIETDAACQKVLKENAPADLPFSSEDVGTMASECNDAHRLLKNMLAALRNFRGNLE